MMTATELRGSESNAKCSIVNEFRLSYTCAKCRTEFVFRADDTETRSKWFTCPVCSEQLEMSDAAKNHGIPVMGDAYLWEALSSYRKFTTSRTRITFR
jgi:DNA-directed RNA polymerase subunit RPC12/RpoP